MNHRLLLLGLICLLAYGCTSPASWQEVVSLHGNGNGSSQIFELQGNKLRLSYTYEATEEMKAIGMGTFSAYLMKEGTQLDVDGGMPDVMLSSVSADNEVEIAPKESGSYYLEVSALGGEWGARLEEYR